MLKLSSSRGIRIDIPVLSVSWSFEDRLVIIQALRKGLIEHEASDTGGVPRWKSSCPDRLAEATEGKITIHYISTEDQLVDIGTKHLNKHRLEQLLHKSRTSNLIDINISLCYLREIVYNMSSQYRSHHD